MPSYGESKKEVDKFMGQGQSQFVSLKELIENLTERVEKLEKENEDLKEIIRGTTAYKWSLGDPEADSITAQELADELNKWANGD